MHLSCFKLNAIFMFSDLGALVLALWVLSCCWSHPWVGTGLQTVCGSLRAGELHSSSFILL